MPKRPESEKASPTNETSRSISARTSSGGAARGRCSPVAETTRAAQELPGHAEASHPAGRGEGAGRERSAEHPSLIAVRDDGLAGSRQERDDTDAAGRGDRLFEPAPVERQAEGTRAQVGAEEAGGPEGLRQEEGVADPAKDRPVIAPEGPGRREAVDQFRVVFEGARVEERDTLKTGEGHLDCARFERPDATGDVGEEVGVSEAVVGERKEAGADRRVGGGPDAGPDDQEIGNAAGRPGEANPRAARGAGFIPRRRRSSRPS